jgi:hypothetical protein
MTAMPCKRFKIKLKVIELTTGVKYYLSGDSIKVVFAE